MSNKPMIKDVNDQVRAWESAKVPLDQQRAKVEAWLQNAEPYVVVWARSIGEIGNITEKAEALNLFFKLAVEKLSAEDRAGFKEVLITELRIKTTQWTERMKVLADKARSGEDEDDLPEVAAEEGGRGRARRRRRRYQEMMTWQKKKRRRKEEEKKSDEAGGWWGA